MALLLLITMMSVCVGGGGGCGVGGGRGEEGLQTRQLQISLCAESELDVHRWCVTALMGSTPAPGGKKP